MTAQTHQPRAANTVPYPNARIGALVRSRGRARPSHNWLPPLCALSLLLGADQAQILHVWALASLTLTAALIGGFAWQLLRRP